MLLLLLAATTAKADDCATTATNPRKPSRSLPPRLVSINTKDRKRRRRVQALDYLYADRNILEPPRFLAKQVPPLPYPEAPTTPRNQPTARRRSGSPARTPTAGARPCGGMCEHQTRLTVGRPLRPGALVDEPPRASQVPVPPLLQQRSRAGPSSSHRGDDATVDLSSGYVEVEQFGGPRWTRSGCPPVCGTWANIWRGTGVFLKLDRPVVAPTRLAAVVELVTQVASKDGGADSGSFRPKRVDARQTGEGVPRRRRVGRRGRRRRRRRRGHGPGLPLLQGGVGAQQGRRRSSRLAAVPGATAAFLARVRGRVRWTGARTSAATASTTTGSARP